MTGGDRKFGTAVSTQLIDSTHYFWRGESVVANSSTLWSIA
jgi:hypothetical protein